MDNSWFEMKYGAEVSVEGRGALGEKPKRGQFKGSRLGSTPKSSTPVQLGHYRQGVR